MSKVIQTVEELDAVLHWRGKHAQAIRERDALQQRLTAADEREGALGSLVPEAELALKALNVAVSVYDVELADSARRGLRLIIAALKPAEQPALGRREPVHKCQKCNGRGSVPTRLPGEGETAYRDRCNLYAEQPAQPQGEPVAWANWKVGSKSYVPFRTVDEARRSVNASEISATQNGPYRVVPLYAEQPAPVAVGLPVDPERERLMEIVQQYPNVDPLKYDAAVRTLRK
ncbi:hypothetical protein C9382_06640 [Pseudomonas aylmerensis]|uniref:Uncharacterized protein n=1 Tax=Pseudomonas aylmerensis TaxID=1869229 RepID=A0A2T4G704_9PSED|nr:hypothetical protein [Pseudomonas aylmerensis]OCW26855.1 hypothetical protein BBG20_14420 [Pseudomonas aylmerensis]PTC31475.1 hypothetical protein C9382_06640 [Pseudomonas aylmerensis]